MESGCSFVEVGVLNGIRPEFIINICLSSFSCKTETRASQKPKSEDFKPDVKPIPVPHEEEGKRINLHLLKLCCIFNCMFIVRVEDFEDDTVFNEPEPEPEHSSLANMLNNADEDEYDGYDDQY